MTPASPNIDNVVSFNFTSRPNYNTSLTITSVITNAGTPVDMSSWEFVSQARPLSQPNALAPAYDPENLTFVGSIDGHLMIQDNGSEAAAGPASQQMTLTIAGRPTGAPSYVIVASGQWVIASS